MRVFVTGATGLIGSAVVRELLEAGHQVLGLARSDASAAKLTAAGAEALRGGLEDLDVLRNGASASDGVIHTAFSHDFSDFEASVGLDRRAVETLCEALAGSGRPFVMASGVGGIAPGRVVAEDTTPDPAGPATGRFVTEAAALAFAERGVRASAVRLPPTVHGAADTHGMVPRLVDAARTAGVSVYPGDGANRWPAVHQLDAAHLFALALEHAPAGTPLHAVDDEGVPVREIAEAIGRGLDVPVKSIAPEDTPARLGFVGGVFTLDIPASSALTQERLDWRPVRPGLLADLDAGHYFAGPQS